MMILLSFREGRERRHSGKNACSRSSFAGHLQQKVHTIFQTIARSNPWLLCFFDVVHQYFSRMANPWSSLSSAPLAANNLRFNFKIQHLHERAKCDMQHAYISLAFGRFLNLNSCLDVDQAFGHVVAELGEMSAERVWQLNDVTVRSVTSKQACNK